MSLVCGIKFPAKGLFPGRIEDDSEVIGAVLLHETEEHTGETEDGIDRHAGRCGTIPDAVIGAVNVTGTVQQIELRY
jgi:hypothetical protein